MSAGCQVITGRGVSQVVGGPGKQGKKLIPRPGTDRQECVQFGTDGLCPPMAGWRLSALGFCFLSNVSRRSVFGEAYLAAVSWDQKWINPLFSKVRFTL